MSQAVAHSRKDLCLDMQRMNMSQTGMGFLVAKRWLFLDNPTVFLHSWHWYLCLPLCFPFLTTWLLPHRGQFPTVAVLSSVLFSK